MSDFHKFDDWHDDWDDDGSGCHRPKKKKCFKTSIDVVQCFDSNCFPVKKRHFPKFRKHFKKHHDDKCCDFGKHHDKHRHHDHDHGHHHHHHDHDDCHWFW